MQPLPRGPPREGRGRAGEATPLVCGLGRQGDEEEERKGQWFRTNSVDGRPLVCGCAHLSLGSGLGQRVPEKRALAWPCVTSVWAALCSSVSALAWGTSLG